MKALFILLLTATIAVAAPSSRTLSKLEAKNKELGAKLEQAMKYNTSTSSVNRALQKDLHASISAQEKAKKEVSYLKSQISSLKKEVEAVKEKLAKEVKKRIQTGRERDIFIVLFSIITAMYFSSMLVGVLKLIPFLNKYSWAAQIIAPLVIFVGAFFGIRLLVQLIVKLIF
jgi:hypothetical protein